MWPYLHFLQKKITGSVRDSTDFTGFVGIFSRTQGSGDGPKISLSSEIAPIAVNVSGLGDFGVGVANLYLYFPNSSMRPNCSYT